MSRTMKLTPLLLVAALAAGGCSDQADTPEEAAANYCRAIEERDRDLFLANVQADSEAVAMAVLDALAETSQFFREFADKYPDTKIEYAGAEVGRIPGYEQVEEGVTAEVSTGDVNRATAKLPNGESLRLIRVDEAWRVDLTGADASEITQHYERVKAAAQAARAKIGKPEYPDEKAPQILRELVEQMMGARAAPATAPAG